MDSSISLGFFVVLLIVIGAIAVAAVVAILLGRRRSETQLQKAIDEARARTEQLDATLDRSRREQQADAQRAAAAEARLQSQEEQLVDLRGQSVRYAELQTAHAQLQERYDWEQQRFRDQEAMLAAAQAQFTDTFKSLSSEALRANNQSFLDLATQNLQRFQVGAQEDLGTRQRMIEQLVHPIREKLERFESHLGEIEKARIGAYETLTTQVRDLVGVHLPNLHKETASLVTALRQPQARGRWGEVQLRRVVEMAGMLEHVDFEEQVTGESVDGRQLRPDLIVRLPGGRQIVVDAKAPLDAYLTAVEARDEATRAVSIARHAAQVRAHVDRLGKKAYFEQFHPAPEFVVLFVPGEAFFSAALTEDPGLIEFGAENRVIPASPTTLIALLRAVAYGWRQEAIARNAQEVADLGRELYNRLCTMGEHWTRVGGALSKSVEYYNRATASLESRVMVSARKFVDLRAATNDRLEELPPLDRTVSAVSATDLHRAPDEGSPDSFISGV